MEERRFTYDKNDNLLSQTTDGVIYTYQYDARNRAKNYTAKLDGREFVFEYDYNAFGQMVGMKYPGRAEWVTCTYDALDRLQTIPGFVTLSSYDQENKLTEMVLANGMHNTFSYDVNGRPVNIGAETSREKITILPDSIIYEAESVVLANAVIESATFASSGKLVKISNPAGVQEGLNAFLINKSSKWYLTGSGEDSGVSIKSYDGYYSQKWRFKSTGDGYYNIINNYNNWYLTGDEDEDGTWVFYKTLFWF